MKFFIALLLLGSLMFGADFRHHDGAALNDLIATPGATSGLTKRQLCDPTFHTGTIRNVTAKQKHQACEAYGISKERCTGQYVEIDHLISLELGGSNDNKNLWPQPYAPGLGAKEKDVVENWLHRQVCSGKMELVDAQKQVSTDWYVVYLKLQEKK